MAGAQGMKDRPISVLEPDVRQCLKERSHRVPRSLGRKVFHGILRAEGTVLIVRTPLSSHPRADVRIDLRCKSIDAAVLGEHVLDVIASKHPMASPSGIRVGIK